MNGLHVREISDQQLSLCIWQRRMCLWQGPTDQLYAELRPSAFRHTWLLACRQAVRLEYQALRLDWNGAGVPLRTNKSQQTELQVGSALVLL